MGMYAERFQTIFGVPLRKYWHPLLRFDVVKFDEEVIRSGDSSMRDAIASRYGVEAATFIEALVVA